jgi:photosystem II stability/assembly factor-like uncharacterized protein
MARIISQPNYYWGFFMVRILALFASIFVISTSAQSGWQVLSSGTTRNLNSVYFTDSLTGYCVGDSGVILKTINGGSSWNILFGNNDIVWHSVFFPSRDTGYVAGFRLSDTNSLIYKTINSGLNWNANAFISSHAHLRSLFFTANYTGICVGDNGTILRTVDGIFWTTPTTEYIAPFSFYGVSFLNKDTGCAVASSYTAIRTFDAGLTWHTINYSWGGPRRPNNFGVCWTQNDTGYIVGETGIFLINDNSVDIGTSYFSQYLKAIIFSDSNTGYAVGDSGVIVKTSDKAANWKTLSSGTVRALHSIYFSSVNIGYVVGDSGLILKTNSAGETSREEDIANIVRNRVLYNYPNPFSNSTCLYYDASFPSFARISIMNIDGKQIILKNIGLSGKGIHSLALNLSDFPIGIYFCHLLLDGKAYSIKMVKY